MTFGTRLLRTTGNLKMAQKLLNHWDIKTTVKFMPMSWSSNAMQHGYNSSQQTTSIDSLDDRLLHSRE